MNAHRYSDEILEAYVRLFRGVFGSDFMFVDDNARRHRAQIVDDFLEERDIRRLDWPSRSPDFNPIEHVWDGLGRAIAQHNPPLNNLQELKTALLEEWSLLPQTFI